MKYNWRYISVLDEHVASSFFYPMPPHNKYVWAGEIRNCIGLPKAYLMDSATFGTYTVEEFQERLDFFKSIKEGDKIKFEEEAHSYTVMCRTDRYIICTKPFNLRHTTLYTIIDAYSQQRGTDNYYGLGYETKEMCLESMSFFVTNDGQLGRSRIPLDIEKINGTNIKRNI